MNEDNGFTLIEVIVALAVVAIVSTSLLQMFVTSSYVNRDAQVMDIANVVAVQLAETFKSNPTPYNGDPLSPDYNPTGYDPKTRYYYGNGNECSATDPAAIMVKSDVPVTNPVVTNSTNATYGYPNFANSDHSFNLKTNYVVTITPTYKVDANDGTNTIPIYAGGLSKIVDNTLSIRVDFPLKEAPHTITLTNDSDVKAEFYVFDANVTNTNISNLNVNDVLLNTLMGASSISYVPATSASTGDKEYDLTLTVYKGISEKVILEYSTKKYLYN